MADPPTVDRRRISRLMALAGVAVVFGLLMLFYDIYQLQQTEPTTGTPPFLCTVICGWLAYMLFAKARRLANAANGQDKSDLPPDPPPDPPSGPSSKPPPNPPAGPSSKPPPNRPSGPPDDS